MCWKLWWFLHKKYQDHVPCSSAYKFVCIDDRFTKPIVVYRGQNAAYEFIKAILKEYNNCKKIMNKPLIKIWSWVNKKNIYFNKINSSWIWLKLINNNEEKVRDHCHVTGKFRGAAHWNCNISFKKTKKVLVIFHN